MKERKRPELSIVIPVYDAEACLPRCVDSVLRQSFTDFEMLLVDDGSTDGSALLCDEFAARDGRIRAFHQPNGGVSSARNKGLAHASGKWVAFVDSDDWLEEGYMAEMVACVGEYPLAVSGFKRFGYMADEAKPAVARPVDIREELPALWDKPLDRFIFWYVWGKLFRTDIVRERGIAFHESMRYSEDHCFVMEYMSLVDSFVFVPSSGYMHLYEKERPRKYRMAFGEFRTHVEQQERSFLRLENETGHRFTRVRRNVHRRFFDFFVYNLLRQGSYPTYVQEIRWFRTFDPDGTFLREVSYSFRRRLLGWVLFRLPPWPGYAFRNMISLLAYR